MSMRGLSRYGVLWYVGLLFVLGSCAAPENSTTPPVPQTGPQTVQRLPASPTVPAAPLRVGVTPNYPPVVFKEQGNIMGLEADLARGVGEALGRPIAFVELGWEALIPALEGGQIDVIMSGMSVTEARQRRVRFVQPYLQIGQMALIRKSDRVRLGSPSLLLRTRQRVGFEAGSTGETFVKTHIPQAQHVALASVDAGLQALRTGAIDVFIHDAVTVWRLGSEETEDTLTGMFSPLTEEYLAWAVRQSDDTLRKDLEAVLGRWRDTGRLQELFQKWLSFHVGVN
jgi:ABC-type amino acid transport substrate-binding protein